MAQKDLKQDMEKLKKETKLEKDEKVINLYSKVRIKSLGGEHNPMKKDQEFEVHPEQAKHLVEKKFASIIGGTERTDVPDLDNPEKVDIMIKA
jgi:hypothetical protein